MKRIISVLLCSAIFGLLLCPVTVSAQVVKRHVAYEVEKYIVPSDTAKTKIPGIKVRRNKDGKKMNYYSDSLVIFYKPDSVKMHYDERKEKFYVLEVRGSEADSSFEYTYSHSYSAPSTREAYYGTARPKTDGKGPARLDFSVPFYNKIKKEIPAWDTVSPGNFGVGLLSASPDALDFRSQRSYEVFLYLCDDGYRFSRFLSLNYGLGLDWKNFTMCKDGMMTKEDDGNILIGNWPENVQPKVSKLRVFCITLPVTIGFNVYRGIGFSIGPVVNLNAYSSIVNKYRLNDEKQKDKSKGAHCNIATVDCMFQLNLKDVGMYVKYSPMNLMDTDYWPEFQHWSAGLVLTL